MEEIPETLIVVGGGVIGLEFASIYQELGSHVILLPSRILKKYRYGNCPKASNVF